MSSLYTVTVGIASNTRERFSSVTIQTGNYLAFQSTGPMPFTVVETWKRIWNYFDNNREYQRNFISDFERYKSLEEVAIYIGIK